MSQTNTSTTYRCTISSSSDAITPGTEPGFWITGTAAVGDAQVLAIAQAMKNAFVANGFADATVSVSKDAVTDVSSQGNFTTNPPSFS